MFVRTLDEWRAAGAEMVLCSGKARSVRFLTSRDGMGLSRSDVRLDRDMDTVLWYKHHWEANYIVEGTGRVTDLSSEQTWPRAPGTLYTVGPTDRHLVEPDNRLKVVTVFTPPLSGDEQHDAQGTLAPSGPVPPGPEGA